MILRVVLQFRRSKRSCGSHAIGIPRKTRSDERSIKVSSSWSLNRRRSCRDSFRIWISGKIGKVRGGRGAAQSSRGSWQAFPSRLRGVLIWSHGAT